MPIVIESVSLEKFLDCQASSVLISRQHVSQHSRPHSTKNSPDSYSPTPVIPVKTYSNVDLLKNQILLDSKGKSGVYRITNTINGKTYVGSSTNLRKRFHFYFNANELLRCNSMPICCALLKYGYSAFKLDILEYCESGVTLIRENYYLSLLNPEYNIAEYATAPMLGRKHSPEAEKKMRGRVVSEEAREKFRASRLGENPFG